MFLTVFGSFNLIIFGVLDSHDIFSCFSPVSMGEVIQPTRARHHNSYKIFSTRYKERAIKDY